MVASCFSPASAWLAWCISAHDLQNKRSLLKLWTGCLKQKPQRRRSCAFKHNSRYYPHFFCNHLRSFASYCIMPHSAWRNNNANANPCNNLPLSLLHGLFDCKCKQSPRKSKYKQILQVIKAQSVCLWLSERINTHFITLLQPDNRSACFLQWHERAGVVCSVCPNRWRSWQSHLLVVTLASPGSHRVTSLVWCRLRAARSCTRWCVTSHADVWGKQRDVQKHAKDRMQRRGIIFGVNYILEP